MPSSERAVHFYVSRAEERNLIAWARQHERPVSAQVRWHLRDILNGRLRPGSEQPTPAIDEVEQPEPLTAA
jgi:hypothetical protein